MRKLLVLVLAALPMFAERLPRTVLPQHYDLTVTPDLGRERFSGEEVITVSVQQPVTSVRLHAAEIEFRSASVEANGEAQSASVALDPAEETATLTFAKPLPVGPAQIRIAYDGILNRQLRGFYIGESNGKKYLASQMEAVDARRAFPSFDEPDMKATFRISVIAEPSLNVITNAPLESETAGPAGKRTVRFATTPRLSTYHIALVVGDFACLSDSVDGIPLRICATPDKIASGQFAMSVTKDLVRFFNGYFGIPYPFTKLDQIALADFAAGAMENPGAITYRERILLNDENASSPESLRRNLSTISHEIAHMWFGDLVTMRWWDDIWLNEGFASWMGRKGAEAVRPNWTRAVADVDAATLPMKGDMLESTRAIRKNAETPAEIEQLFDGIAYGKTASLLRMLETYAGPEKFRDGVNLYIRRNAWSNASASDFAAATAEEAGAEIADILLSYVNQPGVPLVSVSSRCEGNETVVSLRQKRFTIGGARAANHDGQLWTVPVCFAGGGCVLLRERQGTFRLPQCRAELFANDEGRGVYVTSYEPAAQQRLAESGLLSPSERLALLRDAWFLVRSGSGSVASFLDLASAMREDRAASVEILADVAFIEQHLIGSAERPAVQRWLRDFGTTLLTSLGWSPRASDTPDDRELRNKLIETLAESGADPAVTSRARQLAAQWLKDRTAIDPAIVEATLKAAAVAGDARLYESFLQAYRNARNPREKAYLIAALANFSDPVLIRRTLDLSLTGDIRSQDMASVLSNTMSNRAATSAGWQFLEENWTAIAKKLPPGHIERVISAAGLATCDRAWRDRIDAFGRDRNLREASQATAQAVERIEACTAMRSSQQQSVADWARSVSTPSRGR